MPHADKNIVNAANNTLGTGTSAQRKTLLTTNPILPPSGGIIASTVDPNATKSSDVIKGDYTKLKIGAASDSIAFIKLRPNEKNEIGAITFTIKTPADLPTSGSRNGWTPVWWLPWESAHIVKIKIRSNLTDPVILCGDGVAPVLNPPIFFTAGINGCSVFAVGDARNPSVYHGGVNGSMGVRGATELTEDAWRRLLGRAGSTKNIQGIGKHNYISELKHPRLWGDPLQPHDKDDRTSFETTASRNFQAELEGRGNLTNVTVIPWGMVFGLRDSANNWEMTLVRNVVATYKKIWTTKRRFGKNKVTVAGEERLERKYDKDGNLTDPQWRTFTDITNCHTLGYQDFFPGRGSAQMFDLKQIAVF